MSFQDFEKRVKKLKEPLREKIIRYREPDYPIHEKILYGFVTILCIGSLVATMYYMDKNPDRLTVSMRTTFIQFCKIILLVWVPVVAFGKISRGKTLELIMSAPYERTIFLGLMALAGAMVAIWGSI